MKYFRAKFRYRWYNDLEKWDDGNFEIKFKVFTAGKKDLRFWSKNLKDQIEEIIKQIKSSIPQDKIIYFDKYCMPAILNRYFREYFLSHDRNFRITLDRKIDIYDQRIKSLPNIKSKVLRNNHLIVEIKFDRNKRSEINDLLDHMPIRNSRNSKYINSIRQVSGI